MINVFYRNRNTIGQFMVVLILLGTFGFLFTYEFVSDSQASGCCGGGEVEVASFAADSSSDYSSDIPTDTETGEDRYSGKGNIPSPSSGNGDSDCTCISGGCGECGSNKCSSASSVSCKTGCKDSSGCGPGNSVRECCEDKGDKYCPNDEYADSECCEPDHQGNCP